MNTRHDKPQHDAEAAISPSATTAAATDSSTGVLIVGHGTRDPAGVAEFLEAAKLVAAKARPLRVEACFLELAEPTIEAGVARLAEAGVREIIVAPLILFAAGHAKHDIPDAVATAAARHSGLSIRQLPHLGCRPELLALSERRYREACSGAAEAVAPEQTLLLMVGRGSRDPEATAEMHRFAQLRAAAAPIGRLEVAFTAMAEPSLEAAIEVVGRLDYSRVVVQPHLLFAGQLLDRVRATVADAARKFSDRQWLVAGHLGPAAELVDAVTASIFSPLSAGIGVKPQ